jgi:hypothetical protein
MSGIRLYSFREGDRSEYLANFLLSGLGLVTPVPRQEDIGFDFYCQLADQEKGALSFGFPFIMQIKSLSSPNIIYGSLDHVSWNNQNIDWLNKLDLPLFIGIVNKQEFRLDIYSTSIFKHTQITSHMPSVIEFRPRTTNNESEVHYPTSEPLPNWPEQGKGDGRRYTVDLGNPIVTISNDDISNPLVLRDRKFLLRNVIEKEQQNIVFRKLYIPYFQWAKKIITNSTIGFTWFHMEIKNENLIKQIYSSIGPALIFLAINLQANDRNHLIPNIKPFLSEIDDIPKEIREAFAYLFD